MNELSLEELRGVMVSNIPHLVFIHVIDSLIYYRGTFALAVGIIQVKQCIGTSGDGPSTEPPCKARVCFSTQKGQLGCVVLKSLDAAFQCQRCSHKAKKAMDVVSI